MYVCVSVCMHVESIVAESDPRGPASYSLSAGDHNFHKTSIVGAELQTPETHTGNNSYMHAHTHTCVRKYIRARDKTVLSLKPSIPAEIGLCLPGIKLQEVSQKTLTSQLQTPPPLSRTQEYIHTSSAHNVDPCH